MGVWGLGVRVRMKGVLHWKLGLRGVGVRVRMKGVFTTTNPLSHFFILWLGVAPILFFFIFPIFAQKRLNIGFDQGKPGFMGVWVLGLGVRVRMKGVLY